MQFTPQNWIKIAVLPFSGDNRFTQVATDTFNLHLLEQNDFIVLEPQTIQLAISKVMVNSNSIDEISVLQAQQIGQIVNADAVFMGNITSYKSEMTLNAFATIKLIDAVSGKIIAVSHKPSGLLMAYSEHQCAVKAVERTARDMLKVLRDLADKNTLFEVVPQPIKESKTEETSL